MAPKSLAERALIQAISVVTSPTSLDPGPGFGPDPSSPKAAIRRCRAAWHRAFNAYMDQSKGDDYDKIFAAREAGEAYCKAMPILAGHEGISDFIACAAYGILIGAIRAETSGQLLYAAQVAAGVAMRGHKPPKPPAA
jgi:hypothetical protein